MAHWQDEAGCRDTDPEQFFPPSEDERQPGVAAQVAAAKAVCAGCGVWAECLAWAVASGQAYGIWGGLTSTERRRLSRPPVRDAGNDRGTGVPPSEAV